MQGQGLQAAIVVLLLSLATAVQPARHLHKHAWVRLAAPPGPSIPEHVPSINTTLECPSLRIGVINGVNFHFEVLASLLHVLLPYASNVDVYLSKYAKNSNFNGAWDLLSWFPGTFKRAEVQYVKGMKYDLVFLVSPDYELPACSQLLDVMKPDVLVPIIHNGQFSGIRRLMTMAPTVKLYTLAPHVAQALAAYSNETVGWMLPSYPAEVTEDCLTFPRRWVLGLCLRGFALQGKFSNLRRNYSSIWRQMQEKLPVIRDPQVGKVFHVNVLGKGQDRLGLPPSLEMHVAVHRRLMYHVFFNAIAHNVALLPSLATDKYFTEKFSSTILTSLISGTPVLASERLLQAYSFLTRDAVYVQRDGEEETDAMVRISQLSTEEVIKVRLGVLELRAKLNKEAGVQLEALIKPLCSAAASRLVANQVANG